MRICIQYTVVASVGASSDAADVVGANGSFTATTAAAAGWPVACVHDGSHSDCLLPPPPRATDEQSADHCVTATTPLKTKPQQETLIKW